ncbi:LacI family DNA-binding transcriptional regulator [Brevundimonas subvibrioides]|uniref:LacI family DNA-binding transcriptional regulator n=1 Tax=Brevundimonas subvibrioides TaxID=74313 RepID=UPI0022B3C528|nr:LacI family DNA-binding transcriptional regulator [Brevundimonas subvibrioides]
MGPVGGAKFDVAWRRITLAAVTIYDVAARSGVSIKSVSRVLNGEPNVSPALREKVSRAVEALGYRRSLSARSLAGATSSLIAALADAALTIEHWRSGRGNDYLSRLELGALMECRKADYHLMVELVDHGAETLDRELMALLAAIRPGGVLLTPPNSDHGTVLDVLDQEGVNYARIGARTQLDRGFCVSMDERQASFDMTAYLISLGHRRIGFITGPPAYPASQLRQAGYQDALAAHGLALDEAAIVEGDFTFPSGMRGMTALLNSVPGLTGVFASNDDMALGALQAAAAAGLSVPQDLSLVGFDDTPSALFSTPTLTTIRQPVAEMAAEAMRGLIGLLKPDSVRPDGPMTVPYELIRRQSARAI